MAEHGSYHKPTTTTTSTTNCSILCERLLKMRWRRQYLENATQTTGITTKNYIGFTNTKIGPPGYLTEEDTKRWQGALEHTWNLCVKDILIPSMIRKEGAVEVTLADRLNQIDSKDRYVQFIESINKGIKHANRKYSSKYKVKDINRINNREEDEVSEDRYRVDLSKSSVSINFIKRGEVYTREQDGFIKNSWIKDRHNVFVILAHAIYNRTKLHNIIVRKMWEYIDRYEEGEKQKFRPFKGELINGQSRYINSWKQLKVALKNRELKTTRYELDVIARLYCVQIRIMQNLTVYNDPNIVREKYQCIWKTERITGRVVNLLESKHGTWALLEGIQLNYMVDNNIIDGYIEYNNIDDREVVKERNSIQSRALEVQRNLEEVVDAERLMFSNINNKERNEERNNSITESIKTLCYEEGDSEIGLNNEEDVDVDRLGLKDISNKERGEIGSNIITESTKALFYGSRIREIGPNSKETKVDKDNVDLDQVQPRYSNISNETTNTLTIIDSLENRYEEGSNITTESIKALFHEERDGEIGLNSKEDVDVDRLTLSNNETGSNITTESIKALFHEDRDSEIEPNSREIRVDEDNVDLDQGQLRYSNISNATINTLPSIDSLENSLLHLTKRISVMKIRKEQKQGSKVAMKNALWQRCRILERNRRRNEVKKRETKDLKEGKKIKNSNIVFDFTSKGLDSDEIELLSKGESFSIANDKIDEDRLKVDLYNYTRRLRILDEIEERKNTTMTGLSQFSKITITQEGTQNSNRRSNSLVPRKGRISDTQIEDLNKRSSSQFNKARPSNIQSINSQIRSNYSAGVRTVERMLRDNTQRNRNSHIEDNEADNLEQVQRYRESHQTGRSLPSLFDPLSENRNLIRYNNCIQEEGLLVTKNKIPFRDNISPQLRVALKSLREKVIQKEIIITKADKGSGIVILDYDLYIQKGTNYIEIESLAYKIASANQKDIVAQITKERNKIVTKLRKENIIQDRTATYCTHQIEEKITGMKFYYKVHKDTNIITMPLRPLQSCISSPTHHLSQVLTDVIQPLLTVENIPTFIQDSNQLLFRLSKLPALDNNATIITSDVAALYPSIPHKEGLEAMKNFLQTVSHYNITQISCIVQALKLVITKNYVKWNGIVYEQTKGVAMGTPVAVAYANIFMHWVDTEIKNKASYIIEHMRYIDDNLFVIPDHKIADLITLANSILSPSIKYTYEALDKDGEEGLPFLDTRLFISDEYRIESRLYTKKTDKHAYLLPSSYHPAHITKNIPLSTFYRLRRICSKDEWFKADVMSAIHWLEDRDYKYKDITRAIEKAIDKDRWTLIEDIEKKRGKNKQMDSKEKEVNTIPIIITYSQKATQLKTVLTKRQDILDASFTNTIVKPRISYRRQNNIGDLLVQKSLRGPIGGTEQIERKFTECGIKQKYRTQCPCRGEHDKHKCRCCSHANFVPKDIKVKLHKEVSCDSKNVVYLITCRICKKRYVGETQQKLRDRFMQHLNNIQKLKQPLYTHFKTVHKPEEVRITVLETVKSTEPFMRKIREAWWINHLQTLEPKGFNVKLDCNQVYLEDRHKRTEEGRTLKETERKNRRDSSRNCIG